jgi:hypothetical protein
MPKITPKSLSNQYEWQRRWWDIPKLQLKGDENLIHIGLATAKSLPFYPA